MAKDNFYRNIALPFVFLTGFLIAKSYELWQENVRLKESCKFSMEAKLNSPQSEEIPQARLLPRVENAPGYLVPPRIRFPTPLEHLLNPPRELKRLPPIDFNIPSYQETPQETYPRTEDKVA